MKTLLFRIGWRLLLWAASGRMVWHILLCWRCKRDSQDRVTLCAKAADSWLDSIHFDALLEGRK